MGFCNSSERVIRFFDFGKLLKQWRWKLHQLGCDLLLIVQSSMYRAHVRNLQHALTLGIGYIAIDPNQSADLIDFARLIFAAFAIICMNSIVFQLDLNFFDIQFLALRIHPQRH